MRVVLVALLLGAPLWAGCGRPWGVEALEERYPALVGLESQRLGDVTPYVLPVRGEILYFLCRWPDDAEVPVSLPADATDAERLDIEMVLRAWQGAGLGLRFAPGEPDRGIVMEYADAEQSDPRGPRAASAVADCAVDRATLASRPGEVLDARLHYVSIHLTRSGRNAVGREVPWSRAERLGALLHEMGHALGFQGHVRRGDGPMLASVEDVRRAGLRLQNGEPFGDDTLRALYALPTGLVLGRDRVGDDRTAAVERLGQAARRRGLRGPFVQVGDHAARILWLDAHRTSFALKIWNLDEVLRSPRALALYPEPRAADLLRAGR